MMIPAVMASPASGRQVKRGSSAERHVHPEGAGAAAIAMDAFAEVRRHDGRIEQPLEQDFRVGIRHYRPCTDRLTVIGDDADGASLFEQNLARAVAQADVHPGCGTGLGHRSRDRPHSADRVAPGALHAVHLAEYVVQQHIG